MPFQISLSKTDSPKNRLAKALLTGTLTFSFLFKSPTSYLSPVVIINSVTSLIGYNYASIQLDIPRYYYVTDIVLVSSKTYELHLREDVLATYSSDITTQLLFIKRTSDRLLYNLNIKDTMRPEEYIQKTSTSIPTSNLIQAGELSTNGVMVLKDGFGSQVSSSYTSYAIIVANSGDPVPFTGEKWGQVPDRNKTIRLIPLRTRYPSVLMYCCEYQTMTDFVRWCSEHSEEAKSVIGIANYPYSIPHGNVLNTIRIAGKDISTGAEPAKSSYYPISIQPVVLADFLWNPSAVVSDFNGADIGDINFQLFIPYLGNITLDCSLLEDNDEVQVVYVPFYASNECLLMVSNVTKNVILHSETITIAESIPLSSSNAEEIRDTWTKIGIKASVSLVADALKVASGNPLGALSAVGSVARTTADIATTALTTHYHSSVKVTSANSGYSQWDKCYLTITKPIYTTGDMTEVSYALRFGFPCETFDSLESNEGTDTFYMTDTDRLEGYMTDTERTEIISLLNAGVLVPPSSDTKKETT